MCNYDSIIIHMIQILKNILKDLLKKTHIRLQVI